MSQEVVFKTLFYNLKLLGFQSFLSTHDKKGVSLQFDEKMFQTQNEKAFELVSYFLLTTLDKENKKRFIGCFPCYDRKQEADFRKGVTECFKHLEMQPDFQIKFLPVLLHNPVGVTFCNLYISLSNYVLMKHLKKRFHSEIMYSQVDDDILKSSINTELQKYERNEEELVKLKHFWGNNVKSFIERHKTLLKQLQEIEASEIESGEILDKENILKEIQLLETNWESLLLFSSKLASLCKEHLKFIDDGLNNSFDASKITDKNDLDLCELLQTSQIPIKSFFDHISSMSSAKNVYSHISVAKIQMAKHNDEVYEIKCKIKQEHEKLIESHRKLKSDLLNDETIKQRKEWFRSRLPTMDSFPKLVFEPKKVENLSSLLDKCSPPKPMAEMKNRISDTRYSFNFADISTLHYLPPPIVDQSCILSPIRDTSRKYDSFDNFDLEKEQQHFLACD